MHTNPDYILTILDEFVSFANITEKVLTDSVGFAWVRGSGNCDMYLEVMCCNQSAWRGFLRDPHQNDPYYHNPILWNWFGKFNQVPNEGYYDSSDWIRFRDEYAKKFSTLCIACEDRKGTESDKWQLHHITYARFPYQEDMNDVIPLCDSCHSELHDEDERRKEEGLGSNLIELTKLFVARQRDSFGFDSCDMEDWGKGSPKKIPLKNLLADNKENLLEWVKSDYWQQCILKFRNKMSQEFEHSRL